MRDANASTQKTSAKIGELFEWISGLREQSDELVAQLNAAIEAGRAGEAGHGFAMVTGKLRNFAQETVELTRSIDELLKGFAENMAHASAVMEDTRVQMEKISEASLKPTGTAPRPGGSGYSRGGGR